MPNNPKLWFSVIAILAAVAYAVISAFGEPWRGSFEQWFSAVLVVSLILFPVSLLVGVRRDGIQGVRNSFRLAIEAVADRQRPRKYQLLPTMVIIVGVLLFIILKAIER
jgi:hypothetical protein